MASDVEAWPRGSGDDPCAAAVPANHSGTTSAAASTATAKLAYLKANELFRDLTPAQLEPFHHTIQMAYLPRGTRVLPARARPAK